MRNLEEEVSSQYQMHHHCIQRERGWNRNVSNHMFVLIYWKGNKTYWVEARRRVAGVLPCQAVKTQARRMLRVEHWVLRNLQRNKPTQKKLEKLQ